MRALLQASLACALLWTVSAAAAQQREVLTSGEKNQITLTQPATVGDLNMVLQPGVYVLEPRVSDGRHLMRFLLVEEFHRIRVSRAYTGWQTYTEQVKQGDVECRTEPLGAAFQETTVTIVKESGRQRMVAATIKGKAERYVFGE
jgi:hypothetical protein